jgi:hypothetical protein
VAIEIKREGRTMYARISPPLRIATFPSGQTVANVRLQLFLDRDQRLDEGVGRYEQVGDGPREHIPPITLVGVEMPSDNPTIADAYAAIAKLGEFADAPAI